MQTRRVIFYNTPISNLTFEKDYFHIHPGTPFYQALPFIFKEI